MSTGDITKTLILFNRSSYQALNDVFRNVCAKQAKKVTLFELGSMSPHYVVLSGDDCRIEQVEHLRELYIWGSTFLEKFEKAFFRKWSEQTRPVTSLGHQEGRRVFRQGPKLFWPIPEGGEKFLGGFAPPGYAPGRSIASPKTMALIINTSALRKANWDSSKRGWGEVQVSIIVLNCYETFEVQGMRFLTNILFSLDK